MKNIILLILLFIYSGSQVAQNFFKKYFPGTMASAQFAGSIGLYSAGIFKVHKSHKLELGLLAGHLPERFGGRVSTLTLKGNYNPLPAVKEKRIQFEPLLASIFVVKNFGSNLKWTWGSNYPNGYYWWTRSIRTHIALSSQAIVRLEHSGTKRVAIYFEANTNDLYLFSYFDNRKALSPWDIVFFGLGAKVYW